MKQKTINLLTFDELNDEQRAKVLDNYRDINTKYCRDLTEEDEAYKETVEEAGFIEPTFMYDLSYSQGSGAVFECEALDYERLLKDWNYLHKNWIIQILEEYGEMMIERTNYANYYTHERTRKVELYDRLNRYYDKIWEKLEEAADFVEQKRQDLCSTIYDMLEKDYEYRTSDEEVAETLRLNEYYFNEETLRIDY